MDYSTFETLRWEFIKENKVRKQEKKRKQELDQEIDQEKKESSFFFSWSLS